jgi:hypothetical protein
MSAQGDEIFPEGAKWIWLDHPDAPQQPDRDKNIWACFRRTFEVPPARTRTGAGVGVGVGAGAGEGEGRRGVLRITADARYEVYLNGQWVGHGPVRSWPSPWPVDEYEVSLRAGRNVLAVLVTHYGISTFQYLHVDGAAGVIASLQWDDRIGRSKKEKGNRQELSGVVTDANWKCIAHGGYGWPAPRISCQQGWEEQFDARVAPGAPEVWTGLDYADRAWDAAMVVAQAGEGAHRRFERRAVPLLTREIVEPRSVRAVELVDRADAVWTLNPRDFLNAADRSANHLRGRMLLVTHVHSPTAQRAEFHPPHVRPEAQGAWKLNGKTLKFDDRSLQKTDTGVAHARLKAGSNVLMYKLPEAEHLWWGTLNVRTEQPVRYAARAEVGDDQPDARKGRRAGGRGADSTGTLPLSPALSPVLGGEGVDVPTAWLAFGPFAYDKPHVFDTILVDATRIDPGATPEKYERAWKAGALSDADLREPFCRPLAPHMIAACDVYATCASERVIAPAGREVENVDALLDDNGEWTIFHPPRDESLGLRVLFDFGREIVGFHEFEVDAPQGAIIDFHNFEFIQRDGRFNLCEGMNNSFRYVCRAGLQRYRTFQRRGLRYSWMTLRNLKTPLRMRFARVIQSTYPQTRSGEFHCSDRKLEEIWNVGVRSVRCCSEDTYTDCPTYEQTFWVGDARNEALVDLVANGDARLSAHCLRLAGRSLQRSPIVESQVPSGWQNLLPTWSFLWMRWCREHYELSGDARFGREMLTFLSRNVRGMRDHLDADTGLFAMTAWNLFDWAPMDTPARGIVTHINCLAALGLSEAAALATALGDRRRAAEWTRMAGSLSEAVNRWLWSKSKQAYIDCIREDGTLSPVFSQQTQTAAYLSGVAKGRRGQRCRQIIHRAPAGFVKAGSPFFMFFLLEALVREGDFNAMIRTIRDYWGRQTDAGATTFWEMYHEDEERLTRSHCHGWSAAPVVFLTQHVLGVQPLGPGYGGVRVAPNPGELRWAQGRVPTPRGIVETAWTSSTDRFTLSITAPPDMPIEVKLPWKGAVTVGPGSRGKRGAPGGNTIRFAGPRVTLSVQR